MNVAGIAIGLMVGTGLVLPQWHQALAQADTARVGVIVVKATTACFSDMVRVAGYLVPRRVAVVNVEQDGYKITEVGPAEGEQIASGQVLARLVRQTSEGANASAAGAGRGGRGAARAGAAGGGGRPWVARGCGGGRGCCESRPDFPEVACTGWGFSAEKPGGAPGDGPAAGRAAVPDRGRQRDRARSADS